MAQSILLHHQGITKPGAIAQIIRDNGDRPIVDHLRWGWPKNWEPGLVINARSETALSKGIFRDATVKSRCLIPVNSFFERNRASGQTALFAASDQNLITLGGIWTRTSEGNAFLVLTTEPNPQVAPIHNRMPLIIGPADREAWLNPQQSLIHRTPQHWHQNVNFFISQ